MKPLTLGLPLLRGEPGPALGSGEIAAVAAGSVVGAGLCAIMGVAAGALVRNQVVGVVGALLLMFVATPLLNVADETAAELTPFGAAVLLAGDPTGDALSWCAAGLVLAAWTLPLLSRGDRPRASPRLGMSDHGPVRVDERRPRGRRSLAFDLALALVATAEELAQVIGAEGTPRGPAIMLAVVAGGALVVRRTAPLTVLAITLAATVAIVALGDDPSGVTVLIALYTTGALCELRISLVALAATAATAATLSALTVDAPGREASATSGAIIAAGLSVGIWALGAYAQTRRRYVRELQERAAAAEREREQLARIAVHEERVSIARELHDIVAHSVSVMLVGVRGATSSVAHPRLRRRRSPASSEGRAELGRAAAHPLAAKRAPADSGVASAALARRAERARRELPRCRTAGSTGGDR